MIKNQMPEIHLCSTQRIHHSCPPVLGVKGNLMKDTHTVVSFRCGAFHLPVALRSNLHITIKLHTSYRTQWIGSKVMTVFRAGRHLEKKNLYIQTHFTERKSQNQRGKKTLSKVMQLVRDPGEPQPLSPDSV